MRELGVWRSWLAHLVWDQRVLCSSHSTPTYKEGNSLIFSGFLFFGNDVLTQLVPKIPVVLDLHLSNED